MGSQELDIIVEGRNENTFKDMSDHIDINCSMMEGDTILLDGQDLHQGLPWTVENLDYPSYELPGELDTHSDYENEVAAVLKEYTDLSNKIVIENSLESIRNVVEATNIPSIDRDIIEKSIN